MTDQPAIERTGPFWDFVAGRAEGPPSTRALGWRLIAIDPDAGTIDVEFDAPDHFRNPAGVIQGGFLAAMLDETMGPAVVATLPAGQFAPTLELKISFLRPAYPGRLIGTARVLHRGGTIAFVEGSLRNHDGDLVATASATVRIVRPRPTPADLVPGASPGLAAGPEVMA